MIKGKKYGLIHFVQTGETGINHLTFERITYDTGVMDNKNEAAFYLEGAYISNIKIYDGWLESIQYSDNTLAAPIVFNATKKGKKVYPNSSIMDASNIKIEFVTIANHNVSDDIMFFNGSYKNVEIRDILVDGNAFSLVKKYINFNDDAKDVILLNSPKCIIQGKKVL